jgi:hypothetical protein
MGFTADATDIGLAATAEPAPSGAPPANLTKIQGVPQVAPSGNAPWPAGAATTASRPSLLLTALLSLLSISALFV